MSYYSKKVDETFPNAVIGVAEIIIKVRLDGTGKLTKRSDIYTKQSAIDKGASPVDEIYEMYTIDALAVQKLITEIDKINKEEIPKP
ncbi:hypothetical protein LCGC14_0900990 [marine sediment metagenome]|uniref:Uncharacterized protein n=1 Tax=marine sediment metagenome TaxID=412755 RepID=A0A0F9PH86_9ZZZZ